MRIKAAFLAISAVCAIGAAADEIGEAIAAQKAEKRWSVPSGCKQIFTDGKTDRGYYLSYACFYPNQTLRQVYSGYLNGAIGQIDDYSRIAWKKELVARKNLKYDVTIESREEWENPLKVSYIWNGENELTIDLALVTSRSYTFRSKNGGIEVVFWACRDC